MTRQHRNGPIRFCRWLTALALVALPGCNPVFAPPVRSTHGVAPRDLSAGGVEVMGAANVYGSGGPTLGVGVGSGLGADDIPRTVWGSGLVGLEVVLGPVSIPLGTGIAGYSNRLDSEVGWLMFEGGLALRWDEGE